MIRVAKAELMLCMWVRVSVRVFCVYAQMCAREPARDYDSVCVLLR